MKSQIHVVVLMALCFATAAPAQEDQPLPPGAYRLEMIMTSTTRVPFFGASKSASQSISLVQIRRAGNDLTQSHTVCDFRVLDSGMIKMVFPDKFIRALANHTYPIQLEKAGQDWRYRADLGVERIGYRNEGTEDRLPVKIDDPQVFDWDEDGQPGATLKLAIPLLPTADLYIVQRGQSILSGRVLEPGRIDGNIEVVRFDQRVIGARPGFLAKSPEIQPNPQESRFSLSRVAAATTCEILRGSATKP